MGIALNGLRSNRSLSLLTRQVAEPFTASSRNISSFGSRQALTFLVISTKIASKTNAAKKRSRKPKA